MAKASNDPYKTQNATISRTPIDPARGIQQHGIHGNHTSQQPATPSSVKPRRLITVPIEKIRPGRYQKRETLDEEKFQQLKNQIADLGFNFTAVLCEDPDDSNYYNLMMGGHLRIQAAKELGIPDVQAIIRDYDRLQLAKGTYFENNGRQTLTLIEEGLTFKQLQDDEGWTQAKIAEELKVHVSHVSLCLLATTAAPDIQEMLRVDPKRGQRCFYYLQQLNTLGIEKAIERRKSIIKDFLEGKLTTDQVKLMVEQILRKEKGEDVGEISVEATRSREKVVSVFKSFQRYEKLLGDRAPSPTEREELVKVKERIEYILSR